MFQSCVQVITWFLSLEVMGSHLELILKYGLMLYSYWSLLSIWRKTRDMFLECSLGVRGRLDLFHNYFFLILKHLNIFLVLVYDLAKYQNSHFYHPFVNPAMSFLNVLTLFILIALFGASRRLAFKVAPICSWRPE